MSTKYRERNKQDVLAGKQNISPQIAQLRGHVMARVFLAQNTRDKNKSQLLIITKLQHIANQTCIKIRSVTNMTTTEPFREGFDHEFPPSSIIAAVGMITTQLF